MDIATIETGIHALILETGAFIRGEREKFSVQKVESKAGRNNLVSYVDRGAEDRLTKGCRKLLPAAGFIREEGGDENPDAPYRWIIDPLDGTTNFIHDIPSYCISLALQFEEATIFGVVYDVPRDDYYQARLGGGATLNGVPIHTSKASSMSESLFSTGFPYAQSDILPDYLAVIAEVVQASRGMRRFGAAALDLAWVACGKVEGFFEIGLQAWDVAAGELLVREAGGTVTDFSGTDNYIFGRQIVAGGSAVHADFLRLVSVLA
ncbi:UNVERIFIED_CONTAM: hypothetical protein GTU68_012490 [Idotea baltica]|nr:hypothetical protein [Idotea baltica]